MGSFWDAIKSRIARPQPQPFIESIARLELKDGDTVVFRVKNLLSEVAAKRVKEDLEQFFTDRGFKNIRAMILEEGAELEIIECGDK